MGGVRLFDRLVPVAETEAIDWDAVYREELPRVYNFHRFRVFDRATAEDLTSLTFEKAWRARRRYRKSRASVPSPAMVAWALGYVLVTLLAALQLFRTRDL